MYHFSIKKLKFNWLKNKYYKNRYIFMEVANDWVEKYKPKNISEIIGNNKIVDSIVSWLKDFDSNKENFLKEKSKKNDKKNRNSKKKGNINLDNIDDSIDEKSDDFFENDDLDNLDNLDITDNDYDMDPIYKSKNGNKKYSCTTVIGTHGVGKSCIVNAIVQDLKYNVEFINMYSLASNKNINEKINKIIRGINIFDSFDIKNINRKKILIIDEIETATTQVEKKFIEHLLKINEENWFLPIIFISSIKHSKLTTTLKKYTNTIWIKQPIYEELFALFKRILKSEKLKISSSSTEEIIKIIINYSQNDYRRLIHILYDLYKTFNTKSLTIKDIDDYCESTKKKDTDIEIYKCSADLMLNYSGIDECNRLYSGEKVILPLMMHQNYPKIITKSQKKYDEILNISSEISESISTGDIIENYIYSEQNWDMQPIHCYYSCVNPSFKMSSLKVKSSVELLKYELEFPHDLNRTSIKNINKRNIMKANTYLSNMDINDFMYTNALSKKLIDDKKILECTNLYKDYGVKADTIISVLKIDKINVDKNQPQQNTKKIFSKYLDK